MRVDRPRLVEMAGFLIAVALAVIAVGSVVAGERATLLFYDGDSVLFELVRWSIVDGLPFHWAMSAVLFFFPEIPVYLGLRALVSTAQQAVIANALLNLVVLYVLVRLVAGLLGSGRWGSGRSGSGRARSIVVALVAYGAIILCLLSETTGSKETLELTTLFLIGTYYYGSILGAFASLVLVMYLVRAGLAGAPARVAAAGLVALAALSTLSNPLFVLWGAVPLAAALVIAGVLAAARWRLVLPLVGMLAAGSILGVVARIPLAPFVSPSALSYVYPGRQLDSFVFYLARIAELRLTPGAAELILFLVLTAAAIAAAVLALRRRDEPLLVLVASFGLITPLFVFAFNVALGTESVRYLQPLYFAPLMSIVVVGTVVARTRDRGSARTRSARLPHWAPRPLVAVLVALVAAGTLPAAAAVASAAGSDYREADCLEEWIAGRDITGTGMFWDIRALKAYGDESVHLVQTDFGIVDAFPWLVDVAEFYDADVSYVIVARGDAEWERTVTDTVGSPAAIEQCPDYSIMDYAGTPGAATLSALLRESGRADAIERGFVDG